MDDIVILSDSKEYLHNLLCAIKLYLKEELDLDIKTNYAIRTTERGIDIVGFRHFIGYKLLRQSTKKRFIKILKECQNGEMTHKKYCSCISILGWVGWCNSYKFFMKYIYKLIGQIGYYYIMYIKSPNRKFNYCVNLYIKYK